VSQTTPRRRVRALHARGARLLQAGRYREAEALLRKAIAVGERAFGPDHAELSGPLNDLAVSYKYLARFVDAGPLYQRALRITQRTLGPDHPDVATIYHNLGGLEHAAGNWSRGEPFARRAVRLRVRALGRSHPDVAADLTALAALLDRQEKNDEAERLYRRALRILERAHGPRHHLVAAALNNLAAVHQARGEASEAEALYRRALDIEVEVLGPDHPKVAFALNNLAVLVGRRRPAEAARLFRRALALFRRALGPSHPNVGVCLENYAPVLRRLGRRDEADKAVKRSAAILSRIEAVNDAGVGLTGTINPERARFDLVVRRSPIHRLGVFAGAPIPAGRKVIEFTGDRVRKAVALRRLNPRLAYAFELNARWVLDGAIGGSGAEYVNHSCEPNLRARIDDGRIWFLSARAIEEGEELSIDYKYAGAVDVPCRCGAPACRGTMRVRRGAGGSRAPRRRT
jgi:tetratricopeptide (TPR) repeat protein